MLTRAADLSGWHVQDGYINENFHACLYIIISFRLCYYYYFFKNIRKENRKKK